MGQGNPNPPNQFKTGHAKHGGRKKGARNRRTIVKEAMTAHAKSPDRKVLSSLDFFQQMMEGKPFKLPNGETYQPTIEDMKWAAKEAAPYMHPRLAAIRTTDGSKKSHEDWLKELANGESTDEGTDASEDKDADGGR